MQKAVFLLSISLLFFTASFGQNEGDPDNFLPIGSQIPSFTTKDSRGNVFSTENFKGKTVLINFFATWCGPCMKEMPHLEKDVWEKYKDRDDLIFLCIGREHSMEEVKKFVQDKDFKFPISPDPGRVIYKSFAEKYIPRNYLFNKEGKLVFYSKGFLENDYQQLLNVLDKCLND